MSTIKLKQITLIIRNMRQKISWHVKTIDKFPTLKKEKEKHISTLTDELNALLLERDKLVLLTTDISYQRKIYLQKEKKEEITIKKDEYKPIPYTIVNGRYCFKPEDLEPEDIQEN